jgi:hypothetical protein
VRVTNVYSTGDLNMTTTKIGVRFAVKVRHKVSGRRATVTDKAVLERQAANAKAP